MAKKNLGNKRICQSCDAPFYDLNRVPSICPKCGAELESQKPAKPRRGRVLAKAVKPTEAVAAAAEAENEPSEAPEAETSEVGGDEEKLEPVKGGEDDDGAIEDASDIGETDDDLSEVREHVDEAVTDKT